MTEVLRAPNPEAIKVLNEYLQLKEKFENPPEVKLVLHTASVDPNIPVGARDIAIATAYQCYAPGTTVMKPRDDAKSHLVADSTLEAGHHTTRMHPYYTWHIKVSRDLAERSLHSHPYYNSEQQSQRYVEAKFGNYEIPANLTSDQRRVYVETAELANRAYFDLLESLAPEVESRIREMYPKGGWNVPRTADRLKVKIKKISQEVARYVLPIAQRTEMYHTLNELQLLRMFRASKMENFTDEGRYVIAAMINEIAKVDPTILQELDAPIKARERFSEERIDITAQKSEFDSNLANKESILISSGEQIRETLAAAVRNILGATEEDISDQEALMILLDPEKNPYLADTYESGMLDPLTSCLRQVSFTFASKISHAAESQRQRHRRTPGATPVVEQHYTGEPDYITPLVIRENPELKAKYDAYLSQIYAGIQKCIDIGIPKDQALKLLPNAHAIRTIESGDLFDISHKLKQRLCYLAQEEICFVSMDQASQILEVLPEGESLFQAPCGVAVAAGTGKCPEGDRWCGVTVWKKKMQQYAEGRLV